MRYPRSRWCLYARRHAASLILFPAAVVGSQGSFSLFLRFATGHTVAVFVASTFSCFAVFCAGRTLNGAPTCGGVPQTLALRSLLGSHLAFGSARQQLCRAPVADRDLCCKRS